MRESVSAILICEDEVFTVKRQNHLNVFPGYEAFPGGKVDKTDENILAALARELEEELGFDLESSEQAGQVRKVQYLGLAITPSFNPYRFKNHYYKVFLNSKPNFVVDEGEASHWGWSTPERVLLDFDKGELLTVPVFNNVLMNLQKNLISEKVVDFSPIESSDFVPLLQPVSEIWQLLPLSKTFPPANRTNSFIIGDVSERRLLIDPSPESEEELIKYLSLADSIGFDEIFITHHHPDHYEFAIDIARERSIKVHISEDSFNRIKKKEGTNFFENIQISHPKEKDIITKWKGEDVSIYEVPGHDEGQLALAPSSMKWFLVSDLIQTIGTVVIGGDEGDMKKYFSSLERVIKLGPKVVLPSHGIAIGGVNKLKDTLKHRKFREEQIDKLWIDGKNENDILEEVYEGLEPRLERYALKTIRAHLIKLGYINRA